MTISVVDGLIWVGLSQLLTNNLTVNVVFGATVVDEVGSLVDERSALGIGTAGGGAPEGTTKVDDSKFIGI